MYLEKYNNDWIKGGDLVLVDGDSHILVVMHRSAATPFFLIFSSLKTTPFVSYPHIPTHEFTYSFLYHPNPPQNISKHISTKTKYTTFSRRLSKTHKCLQTTPFRLNCQAADLHNPLTPAVHTPTERNLS